MKTTFALPFALSALSVLAIVSRTSAQSYAIDWHTIGGGGGTSTGGVFAVSGTIGQPEASSQPTTNGNFSLTGGFWSLFAVQTPGAPLLSIFPTTTNTAIVSWPVAARNFQLQESPDLSLANSWSPVAQPAVSNGNQVSVTIPTAVGSRFYRLKSQ